MRHNLLASAISLCTLALGFASQHAFAASNAADCGTPVWPKEALRYELEGTTVTKFDITPDGKVENAGVARSSGWKILDDASVEYQMHCKFAPAAEGARPRTGRKMAMQWQLDARTTPIQSAELLPETCPASDRFTFTPVPASKSAAPGVLVRLLVSPTGEPFGIKFEGAQDPAAVEAAGNFIKACRFRPSTMGGKPVSGNLTARIAPNA